jgi:hypothetical protein
MSCKFSISIIALKRSFSLQFYLEISEQNLLVILRKWIDTTGYELDDRDSGIRFPAATEFFFFFTASRPTLGPIKTPIQWVIGDSFPGGKEAGA